MISWRACGHDTRGCVAGEPKTLYIRHRYTGIMCGCEDSVCGCDGMCVRVSAACAGVGSMCDGMCESSLRGCEVSCGTRLPSPLFLSGWSYVKGPTEVNFALGHSNTWDRGPITRQVWNKVWKIMWAACEGLRACIGGNTSHALTPMPLAFNVRYHQRACSHPWLL